MDEFDNFDILDEGILREKIPNQEYPLWKFLVLLVSVFVIMVLTSFVVCISSSTCRRNVPTVHSLLGSPISGPYMLLALSSGIYVFFITSLALHFITNNKIVVITAVGVYVSIGCMLVVFPFTGWSRNWAIVIFIITFLLWMLSITWSTRKSYNHKTRKLGIGLVVVYTLSSFVYLVLKLLDPRVVGKDTGILVVELVGLFSVMGFMAVCLSYVWKVKITISK